mmetsp:Transcript_48971/g.158211  ORF Transcript_48971/g.158211 Transcript_48971/m.158211 type:complete len:517 (+) Transcript_48971:3097-4647(+)
MCRPRRVVCARLSASTGHGDATVVEGRGHDMLAQGEPRILRVFPRARVVVAALVDGARNDVERPVLAKARHRGQRELVCHIQLHHPDLVLGSFEHNQGPRRAGDDRRQRLAIRIDGGVDHAPRPGDARRGQYVHLRVGHGICRHRNVVVRDHYPRQARVLRPGCGRLLLLLLLLAARARVGKAWDPSPGYTGDAWRQTDVQTSCVGVGGSDLALVGSPAGDAVHRLHASSQRALARVDLHCAGAGLAAQHLVQNGRLDGGARGAIRQRGRGLLAADISANAAQGIAIRGQVGSLDGGGGGHAVEVRLVPSHAGDEVPAGLRQGLLAARVLLRDVPQAFLVVDVHEEGLGHGVAAVRHEHPLLEVLGCQDHGVRGVHLSDEVGLVEPDGDVEVKLARPIAVELRGARRVAPRVVVGDLRDDDLGPFLRLQGNLTLLQVHARKVGVCLAPIHSWHRSGQQPLAPQREHHHVEQEQANIRGVAAAAQVTEDRHVPVRIIRSFGTIGGCGVVVRTLGVLD